MEPRRPEAEGQVQEEKLGGNGAQFGLRAGSNKGEVVVTRCRGSGE